MYSCTLLQYNCVSLNTVTCTLQNTTVQYHCTKVLPKESQLNDLEVYTKIHVFFIYTRYSLLPQVFRKYCVHETLQKFGFEYIIQKENIEQLPLLLKISHTIWHQVLSTCMMNRPCMEFMI